MNLFYTPDAIGGTYPLSEEESNHIARVLRFKKGGIVYLTNGKGDLFKAEIINDNPKSCVVNIIETTSNYGKRNYSLHIAIAPTKNTDRFEWFLEKATEIGIEEITPLICEHSERREVKPDRLNKVIVSAMKQSVKCFVPKLTEAQPFNAFVSQNYDCQKLICSVDALKTLLMKDLYVTKKDVLLLIGPEGDFSPNEIALAEKSNFKKVSLGDSRLRTETAGIVACHSIALLNQ